MKKIFFTLSSVLIVFYLSAQITFQKSYEVYNSAFSDLVFAQDDGYLMAMISMKDKYYLSFIKTDLKGDTLWTKDYDQGITSLTDLTGTEDETGSLYIAIGSESLVKLDNDANIIWSMTHWGSMRKFIVKNDILWGCIDANGGNYLMKRDALTGDSLWRSQIFNYEPLLITSSRATSIVATDNGDVIVTVSDLNGYDQSLMPTEFFRLQANSTEVVSFNIEYDKEFVVHESKSTGNEIVSLASNFSYNGSDNVCYFIRYSSDGTLQTFKEQRFGYTTIGLYRSVITAQNEVVAMGGAGSGPSSNVMLHCFSMNGDSLWTQLLAENVTGADLKIASDEGYIITGALEVLGDYIPYLIKTNSMGTLNGINEINNTLQIETWPNPAANYVTFNTTGIKNGKLIISDSMGRLCDEKTVTSNKTVWNCNSAKEGVYFYRLVSSTKNASGKIVIKR